eukprot:81655_1
MAPSNMDYSTIVSIIYFVVNIIFMFGLAFHVYRSGNHKLKSKSYLKDVWSQRKLFFPLIIHFYDTATDIGVIYNWYGLMKDEEDPNIDYESVDMKTFFWCGIAFLSVYRVLILMQAVYRWLHEDQDGQWYYVLLVLIDLYIFVIVYDSFNEANGIITKNAERRQKNAQRKKQKREEINKQLEVAIEMGQISTDKAAKIQIALNDQVEIEPTEDQGMLQMVEAVTESMPQIVLQSVFLIRSANDSEQLAEGSNMDLLLFSVLASLFSISNKFVWLDKARGSIREIARSLKPRESFPDCVNYWYIMRAFWRLCHLLSKFVAFTLIWAVMGGAWLPIWAGTIYMVWSMIMVRYARVDDNHDTYNCSHVAMGFIFSIFCIVALFVPSKQYVSHFIYKWIETTIALTAITVFGTIQFGCGICADSGLRMLFGIDNDRIRIYWIMGVAAHVMDGVLYSIMYSANIVSGAHVIYHNRWTEEFGLHEEGEQFKNFITDYENERITGIRMSVGANNSGGLKSFEFQINGIWRGRIGSHEPINEQELLLDADEYVNKARLKGLTGVHFFTNKGNVVEAGTLGEDEEGIVTLQGDFRLVDCKGTCDTEDVWSLSFLWHKVAP